MADPGIDEIVADISQREPDFYGRAGAPIWCVGEPTLQEIRELLELEGILVPSPRMNRLMLEHGCWNLQRKRA